MCNKGSVGRQMIVYNINITSCCSWGVFFMPTSNWRKTKEKPVNFYLQKLIIGCAYKQSLKMFYLLFRNLSGIRQLMPIFSFLLPHIRMTRFSFLRFIYGKCFFLPFSPFFHHFGRWCCFDFALLKKKKKKGIFSSHRAWCTWFERRFRF